MVIGLGLVDRLVIPQRKINKTTHPVEATSQSSCFHSNRAVLLPKLESTMLTSCFLYLLSYLISSQLCNGNGISSGMKTLKSCPLLISSRQEIRMPILPTVTLSGSADQRLALLLR